MLALSAWYRQCPKPHRYGTAQYCYTLGLDILKVLLRTIAEPGRKRFHQHELSLKVDELKIFLRLAKDTGALTPKHYINLQTGLREIGKQLGGWMAAPRSLASDAAAPTKRPPEAEAFCKK